MTNATAAKFLPIFESSVENARARAWVWSLIADHNTAKRTASLTTGKTREKWLALVSRIDGYLVALTGGTF